MATAKTLRNPDEVIVPRPKILKMLDAHNVPWKTWGMPGTTSRTLQDFFTYHEKDRFYLRNLRNGKHAGNGNNGHSNKFVIDVHAAIVIVKHRFNRKWFELYEECQMFDGNPKPLVRSSFNGIAETACRTEKTMRASAMRCLAEELQFCDPSKYELSECLKVEHREMMPSEKFPGVWAVYHRHIFECIISRSLFRKDGYAEREGIKTIYFKWKPASQIELQLPP